MATELETPLRAVYARGIAGNPHAREVHVFEVNEFGIARVKTVTRPIRTLWVPLSALRVAGYAFPPDAAAQLIEQLRTPYREGLPVPTGLPEPRRRSS